MSDTHDHLTSKPLGERPCKYLPLRDHLGGETEADNERHVVARVAFLNRAIQNERFQEVFDAWWRQTGLGDRALILRERLTRLAALAKVEHWSLVSEELSLAECEEHEDPQGLVDRADAAVDRFLWAWNSANWGALVDELTRLVRSEWKLSWGWLVAELVEWCAETTLDVALLRISEKTIRYAPKLSVAPPIAFHFETQPEETVDQAAIRLLQGFGDTLARLEQACEQASLPAGKTTNDETTERYVDWLYRHQCCGETIYHIEHNDPYESSRQSIQQGIKRAKKLLSLSLCPV